MKEPLKFRGGRPMLRSETEPTQNLGARLEPQRSHFKIAEEFADYFPVAEFPAYKDFLAACQGAFKRERRTLVTILQRPRGQGSTREPAAFVLKLYRYPLIPRIRTGLQMCKAEREYNNLRHLHELGVGGAQAAGFGVERDSLGFVRSCFVITRFIEHSVHLAKWYKHLEDRDARDEATAGQVFTELGRRFRLLHRARFFLFTAKATNILICQDPHGSRRLIFIDVPYARTLRWPLLARWAQARDIGVVLGSVRPMLSERAMEFFFRAYLPDPLGLSAEAVRRYALRQMRAKRNQTPISRWVHGMKRRWAGKTRRQESI